ncbi:MAG: response regulator [Candidatus Bathyarchaeia archaeon]
MLVPNKPSILIIDDDQAILHMFTRLFQRNGYAVTVAAKGSEAIEKLNDDHFDVALVDLRLPDMEGTELFPVITKKSPGTVKIMLTGDVYSAGNLEGADALLGKPVNPCKLLSIIDSKLKNRCIET